MTITQPVTWPAQLKNPTQVTWVQGQDSGQVGRPNLVPDPDPCLTQTIHLKSDLNIIRIIDLPDPLQARNMIKSQVGWEKVEKTASPSQKQ